TTTAGCSSADATATSCAPTSADGPTTTSCAATISSPTTSPSTYRFWCSTSINLQPVHPTRRWTTRFTNQHITKSPDASPTGCTDTPSTEYSGYTSHTGHWSNSGPENSQSFKSRWDSCRSGYRRGIAGYQ